MIFRGDYIMVRVINLLAAILVLSALVAPALADAALKRELVEQVSEVRLPVLARYQELSLMHKQILITLQTLPEDQIAKSTREWTNIAAGSDGILAKFDKINDLASKDDSQSHKTAIADAIVLKDTINSLEGYKQAKDNFITFYPGIALQHFFTDQGAYFETLAENETETHRAITYYEDALNAYREAEDITKTTYIDLKVKEMRSEYLFDMETANESCTIGETKFEDARYGINHTGNPVSVAIGILASKRSERELTTVYRIYTKHGDERAPQIGEMVAETTIINSELVNVFLKYAAVSVALFIALLAYVLSLIFRWTHAVEDTLLGNEVIQ